MFNFWRETLSATAFLALFFILLIGLLPDFDWQFGVILFYCLGITILHKYVKYTYRKDFDARAYLSAIIGIAVFTTLGSFSFDELKQFGFHFSSIGNYFSIKLLFYFWSIVWLPVVLEKFLKNKWFDE